MTDGFEDDTGTEGVAADAGDGADAGDDDDGTDGRSLVALSALRTAAYCPRQLYYRRRDDAAPTVPGAVRRRRALADRYAELRGADDESLRSLPIDVSPDRYRANLDRAADLPDWPHLRDAPVRPRLVEGRDCRGVVHRLLADRDPPAPSLLSTGTPPDRGVHRPRRVQAVGAALAVAHEFGRSVDRAFVEYPARGVVRTVRLTARNRGAYRETLRTVRAMEGPPPRLDDRSKCDACEYVEECGVRTRSLRSLLGL